MEITNVPTSSRFNIACNRLLTWVTFENLSLVSLIAMSVGVLYSSYMGLSYSEIISAPVSDGWCEPTTQGIGKHCFGDFYAPNSISSSSNPWNSPGLLDGVAYTPLSFSYFNVISAELLLGIEQKLPLYINLVFTIFALSFPGLHIIVKKIKKGLSGKWILAVMLTSTPSLMMIDRGSNNFILVPLLYMYFVKIREGKSSKAFLLLFVMSLWKPQMLLFGFLLISWIGLRKFSLAMLATISGLLVSFILYPNSMLVNIIDWVENSRAYQTYAPSPSIGNYSFANFVGLLESTWHTLSSPGQSFSLLDNPLSINEVSAISLMYGVMAFGVVLLGRKHLSANYQFLAVTVFFLQLPGTTFGYYTVFLILPLIFMIIDNEFAGVDSSFKALNYVVYGALLFAMVPAWPVNMTVLGIDPTGMFSASGITWVISHLLLSILSVLLILDILLTFLRSKVSLGR